MAISTLDNWIASVKQRVTYSRIWTARSSVAAAQFISTLDLAGRPGAGVLAGTSTAAGTVQTDALAGFPPINSFGGGTGYLSSVDWYCSVVTRFLLYDLLFKAGAYAFNAATTLASQPSYSARVPGGTDYTNTELWFEAVTSFTGNLTLTVTYTNEAGTTGRTTGAVAFGSAPLVGRMVQLPLQAGDIGVQKVESVTATVSSAGTFNINVMRRLWTGRNAQANFGGSADMFSTGMPQIFEDSALLVVCQPESTSSGLFELSCVIAVN